MSDCTTWQKKTTFIAIANNTMKIVLPYQNNYDTILTVSLSNHKHFTYLMEELAERWRSLMFVYGTREQYKKCPKFHYDCVIVLFALYMLETELIRLICNWDYFCFHDRLNCNIHLSLYFPMNAKKITIYGPDLLDLQTSCKGAWTAIL